MHVCNQLCPPINKNIVVREAVSVEKRVAVTIWHLATSISLFVILSASLCSIFHEVCKEIVCVLMPIYINWPEGDQMQGVNYPSAHMHSEGYNN